MGKLRDDRSKDLFRPALEEIIDMGHALVLWKRPEHAPTSPPQTVRA